MKKGVNSYGERTRMTPEEFAEIRGQASKDQVPKDRKSLMSVVSKFIGRLRRLLGPSEPAKADKVKNIRMREDLMEALHTGDLNTVSALIEKEPEQVRSTNYQRLTPLTMAAVFGHLDIAKYVLSKEVDIESADGSSGSTPLITAACNKQVDIVRLLLDYGARVFATDCDGDTALHAAMTVSGNLPVVKLLLAHGARKVVNWRGKMGWTPLHKAAFSGFLEYVSALVEAGADPNIRTGLSGVTDEYDLKTPMEITELGVASDEAVTEYLRKLASYKEGQQKKGNSEITDGECRSSSDGICGPGPGELRIFEGAHLGEHIRQLAADIWQEDGYPPASIVVRCYRCSRALSLVQAPSFGGREDNIWEGFCFESRGNLFGLSRPAFCGACKASSFTVEVTRRTFKDAFRETVNVLPPCENDPIVGIACKGTGQLIGEHGFHVHWDFEDLWSTVKYWLDPSSGVNKNSCIDTVTDTLGREWEVERIFAIWSFDRQTGFGLTVFRDTTGKYWHKRHFLGPH